MGKTGCFSSQAGPLIRVDATSAYAVLSMPAEH